MFDRSATVHRAVCELPQVLPVGALRMGDRFRLFGLPERRGQVLCVGPGAAVVRYDTVKHRHVEVRRGTEVVRTADFDEPAKPVSISLNTMVVVL